MAQALRHADITEQHSVRRAKFEADTFPHLDALWTTALWLTRRSSLAENLVLTTITRAYREWHVPDDRVGDKSRLFRMLTREFFGCGKRRRRWGQSGALSENIMTTAGSVWRIPRGPVSAIELLQLPLLNEISDVSVKGAIARLRPRSRLIMLLFFRERFSYSEITYITDLSRDSVRTILSRLRAVVLRAVCENNVPFILPQDTPAGSTFGSREDGGGTIMRYCKE
jgi:RNA polymerase sigma-70 factor, ECF subfamily